MSRTRCKLLVFFIALVCAQGVSVTRADAPPTAETDALSSAFQELVAALGSVEREIRRSPSFGSEAEQVGGYRHLLRSLAKGLEAEVLQDADYPYFRILDFWLREGGDNPDQRYAFSPIRGGETYRIWGQIGSAARVEFQIYAGRPWDGSGRSVGYLAYEDLQLNEDGSFEVWVSAHEQDGNWLNNPADGTTLFARHIYDDWNEEATGDVHIDRVGFEGTRRPPETARELAARMRNAATMFSTSANTWPALVNRRYVFDRQANTLTQPYDTYAMGGVKGRWMSGAHFDLGEGEALVLRMPRTTAAYQAAQLTDMWFASLEHGNQVSSLNTQQSILAPDDAYYYVISQLDPGYANWLDSGALSRGTLLLRWDGMQGQLESTHHPTAQLVALEDLASVIPGFEVVKAEYREAVYRQRRHHLQLRSHR